MTFKLTRERILLGGLMLAAGVGLMVDRFVLAGPADASADGNDSTALTVAHPTAAAAARAATAARPQTADAILSARIQALAGATPTSADEIRDVFTAPAPAETPIVASATPTTAPSAETSENIAALRARWQARTLSGVFLRSDGRKIAIVDGHLVPLGSWFDGLRLVQLTQQTALFTDGHAQITLRASRAEKTD